MSRLAAELPRCMAEFLAVDADEAAATIGRRSGSRQTRALVGLTRAIRRRPGCGIQSQPHVEAVWPHGRSGRARNLSGSLSTVLSTECDNLAQRNAGVLRRPGPMLASLTPVPHR